MAQVGFGFWGAASGFSPLRIVELASFVVIGYGVLSAKGWGRRGCIVLGLTSYGWTLANLTLAFQLGVLPPFGPLMWAFLVGTSLLFMTGPALALAFYGAHSSTQTQFTVYRRTNRN